MQRYIHTEKKMSKQIFAGLFSLSLSSISFFYIHNQSIFINHQRVLLLRHHQSD